MIGQKIQNYEVRELIGQGAMGTVYRAHDEALDRDVAIKFLATQAAPTPTEVERFYREAQAAAGLAHPNVVVIHDIGEHEGSTYFVMELLSGTSFRQMVQEGKRPPWREGLQFAAQVCRALEAAHAKDLLHRDIKPDNVWLAPDGQVKVLDFGIARFSTSQALTQASETVGTPEYMAPEQIMGEALDGRTDLYALGVLLYELFTGRRPFSGPNAVTVIYKQMEEDPTPPGQLAKDLPVAVEKLILRAMAKDPAERYASAVEMREAIEALLEGREAAGEPALEAPETPEALPARAQGTQFECRMVGREDEWKALKAAVDGLEDEAGSTILIGGEAGMGKTRLAQETMAYARGKGALVLQGSCLYSEGPEPYLPFMEALGQSLESADGPEREKVLAFIREEAPELEELTSRLMTVIRTRFNTGLIDSEATIAASKERLFEAITQVLLFLSRETPVVLLLDDLHWADSGSLQLLYYVARNAMERRLLILGTYRTEDLLPDGEGRAHPLVDTMQRMSREGIFQKIELEGLGMEGVNLMLRFIFRRAMLSADFRSSLFEETGGNPFFLIEVLKLLRDEGVLLERRGIWREKREITRADLPDRVYDVVVRRIERLTDDQRELLQIAAVAGERFTSGALVHIAEEKRVRVLRVLNRLEQTHQLVRSEGEAYAFCHAKIREILYDEISQELRREYHLACGAYLEAQAANEGKEPVADLARHFYDGGASDKALPYLVRAAERARRMFAYREARDCYRRALEVLPDAGDVPDRAHLEPSLLYKLGCAYDTLGETQTALDHLERAEGLAGKEDDDLLVAGIHWRMAQMFFRSSDYAQATRQYRQSADCYHKAGDQQRLCEVLVGAANIPFQQGDWKRVESYFTRALRVARQVGAKRPMAAIYMKSGVMASIRGDSDRAVEFFEKSRQIYEAMEDLGGLSQVYVNMGWSHAGQKEWTRAKEAYEEALALSVKTRNISREAKCYLNLAEVFLETGDPVGSKRACLKALEIFKKVNRRLETADVFKTLGQVATAEQKWEEARSYFEKGISMTEALPYPKGAGSGHLEYARMLKAQGDLDGAAGELERSIAWFEKIDAQRWLEAAEELKAEMEALRQ